MLVKDKGGSFGEALLESKDGTLLAPSNEAMRKVDKTRLNYILSHQQLRNEYFGLHFVRERLGTHDKRLRGFGEQVFFDNLINMNLDVYLNLNSGGLIRSELVRGYLTLP